MSKINIEYELVNKDTKETINNKLIGIFLNDCIIYSDNVKTKIDLVNNILYRENSNYKIELNFNTKKGYYLLKAYNKKLLLNIKINCIKNCEYFYVDYSIYSSKELMGNFIYKLIYKK